MILSEMKLFGHEQVTYCQDQDTGLKAIIAIHNTVLGPSLGGTRFWDYAKEGDATIDALRLSRGMTYKSSLAGLNLGGGKAVILGDPAKLKSEALLRRFGKFIESLGGKYITAEDVGMSSRDMEIIHQETKFVSGLPEAMGGGGDPSPVTAYGVYVSMKAAVKEVYGNDALAGKKILIQGLGSVGIHLAELCFKENAKLLVYDIRQDRIRMAVEKYKAIPIEEHKMLDEEIDIYAPCALGAGINTGSISRLKCAIICGAANNQLEDEGIHGEMVAARGILYAPDFVVNAGGIINVYYELQGYVKERALRHAEQISPTISEVFRIAKEQKIPTYLAANRLAERRIEAIAKLKTRM